MAISIFKEKNLLLELTYIEKGGKNGRAASLENGSQVNAELLMKAGLVITSHCKHILQFFYLNLL